MDLSNKVLNIDFGKEAAKIQEVKYLLISPVKTHAPRVCRIGRYFFQTLTLTFNPILHELWDIRYRMRGGTLCPHYKQA